MANKEKFSSKMLEWVPDELKDGAGSMSSEDLKEKLIECEHALNTTLRDKRDDPKLLELKESTKEYAGGYNDLIKTSKCSIQYILYTLEDRGNI